MIPRHALAFIALLALMLVASIGLAANSTVDEGAADVVASSDITTPAIALDPSAGRVTGAVFANSLAASRKAAPTGGDTTTTTTTSAADPSTTTTTAGGDAGTATLFAATPGAAGELGTTTSTTSTTEPPASTTTLAAETTTTTTEAPADPPSLGVEYPADGAVVTERLVSFRGHVTPGSTVVSGAYEADVTDDGHWVLALVLAPGENGASFTAGNEGGETSVRIVVTYDAPEPTTTTTTTEAPPTTEPPETTTTTAAESTTTTTTTAPAPAPEWSPRWPADSPGRRDIESWRGLVARYWPANRVDCVLGLIQVESGGDPAAHNTATDARGLLQHLGRYWRSRATGAGFVDADGLVATAFNGEANIAAGAYLANYYDSLDRAWWTPWGSLPGYGSCSG